MISRNVRFEVDCETRVLTITWRVGFCTEVLDSSRERIRAVLDVFARNWGSRRDQPFRSGECRIDFVLEPCSNPNPPPDPAAEPPEFEPLPGPFDEPTPPDEPTPTPEPEEPSIPDPYSSCDDIPQDCDKLFIRAPGDDPHGHAIPSPDGRWTVEIQPRRVGGGEGSPQPSGEDDGAVETTPAGGNAEFEDWQVVNEIGHAFGLEDPLPGQDVGSETTDQHLAGEWNLPEGDPSRPDITGHFLELILDQAPDDVHEQLAECCGRRRRSERTIREAIRGEIDRRARLMGQGRRGCLGFLLGVGK